MYVLRISCGIGLSSSFSLTLRVGFFISVEISDAATWSVKIDYSMLLTGFSLLKVTAAASQFTHPHSSMVTWSVRAGVALTNCRSNYCNENSALLERKTRPMLTASTFPLVTSEKERRKNNTDLMEELLGYEIESILLNRIKDVFPHHQRITIACNAFRNALSSSVKKERDRKDDYEKKMENNASIIANTSSQMTHVQNELATVALQRKVVEKQINIVRTQQEKFREEIDAGIVEEHGLALDIIDLERDLVESKVTKKLKWDGMKRIVRAYKSALQLSIHITDSAETCNKVRLIFFKHEKDENPKYYVDLTRNSDSWRVDLIHPSLKPKHEEQLKCVLNFKKHCEVSDITAFLCILRKIFKQQRAKDEAHSSQSEPGKV